MWMRNIDFAVSMNEEFEKGSKSVTLNALKAQFEKTVSIAEKKGDRKP